MARGLGGLAQGLLAGAGLGLQMRQQEQRELEAADIREMRQAEMERQKKLDAQAAERAGRETEAYEYEKSLRPLRRQALEQELSSKQAQEKRMSEQERRLTRQQEMQQQEFDWQVSKQQRAELDQNLASMAPIEYQRVASGGDFSDEFMEASKGTRFDPAYMAKPEFKAAAKVAYEYTDDLVTRLGEGGQDVTIQDINNPEYIGALNTLMAPEVNKGIGQKDAKTGKTIESKRIVGILPYQNKGLVLEVENTLSDGTKYTAPVTEGRSQDPNDPVRVIPVDKFLDHINGYMQMASAYNQPDLINAANRYAVRQGGSEISSQEVTRRQYLREIGEADKWEMEQINKLNPDLMTEEDLAKKQTQIKDQAEELRQKINKRYNMAPQEVGSGNGAAPVPKGGGQPMTDLATWSANDARKAAFVAEAEEQAAMRGIDNPFKAYTPDELDKLYQEWANDTEAQRVAKTLRQ